MYILLFWGNYISWLLSKNNLQMKIKKPKKQQHLNQKNGRVTQSSLEAEKLFKLQKVYYRAKLQIN